jgi:hypothetical protein
MTMKLIETKTLVSTATLIEFTSIPQIYTDLFLLASLRSNANDTPNDTYFTFNGIAPSAAKLLYGTGSDRGPSNSFLAISNGGNTTANTFSNISLYIPNYTSSVNKSLSLNSVMETNASFSFQNIAAGLWSNTAAITSVRFLVLVGSYVAGSTISLYGITKGSDGIVTAP